MVKLIWETSPTGCTLLILLQALHGFIPIATALVIKQIFDNVFLILSTHALDKFVLQKIIILLIFQAILSISNECLALLNSYINSELGRQLTLKVQLIVYEKINAIEGLSHFENSEFYDTIRLAIQNAQNAPLQMLITFTVFVRNIITLLAFGGSLLSFNPFLAMVVGVLGLPYLYIQLKLGQRRFTVAVASSPKERKATYYGQVLSSLYFATELRLFNLSKYFIQMFHSLTSDILNLRRQRELNELKWKLILNVTTSLVTGFGYVTAIMAAIQGWISLGDITFFTAALTSSQASLNNLIFSLANLNESILFFTHFIKLKSLTSSIKSGANARIVAPLTKEIEFRNVSFRYSDNQPWVLRQINLSIPRGKCVAIVGLNGSGKTTLVKLLMRLYDPTEGQILWDGIDIREFEPSALRKHISAILQNFVRYELTVEENVGSGEVEEIQNTALIQQAAIKADVHDMIEKLPEKYKTILSLWLGTKGLDLSGGQWQKIAVARMFMRDADLFILDEPTASLDPRAEYDLYNQFVKTSSGHTSLIISHRFSTIRIADIIAVIQDGKIIEYGSHQELIGLSGAYAELFHMQTSHYVSALS